MKKHNNIPPAGLLFGLFFALVVYPGISRFVSSLELIIFDHKGLNAAMIQLITLLVAVIIMLAVVIPTALYHKKQNKPLK